MKGARQKGCGLHRGRGPGPEGKCDTIVESTVRRQPTTPDWVRVRVSSTRPSRQNQNSSEAAIFDTVNSNDVICPFNYNTVNIRGKICQDLTLSTLTPGCLIRSWMSRRVLQLNSAKTEVLTLGPEDLRNMFSTDGAWLSGIRLPPVLEAGSLVHQTMRLGSWTCVLPWTTSCMDRLHRLHTNSYILSLSLMIILIIIILIISLSANFPDVHVSHTVWSM